MDLAGEGIGATYGRDGHAQPAHRDGPGSAQLPYISELQQILAEAGVNSGVFSDFTQPLGADVEQARQCYRKGGHDSVIAIGGGSGMDGGKATALTAHNDCTIWEFDFDRETELPRDHAFPADLYPYDGGHRCRDREHCGDPRRAGDEILRVAPSIETLIDPA